MIHIKISKNVGPTRSIHANIKFFVETRALQFWTWDLCRKRHTCSTACHDDDVKNGIWNLKILTFGMFALGIDTATVLAVVLGIATGGVVAAAGAVPVLAAA